MFVLHRIIGHMELPFQNQGGFGYIRHLQLDVFPVFLFQILHAAFFQQYAVVDDADIVRQKCDLGKNVAGDQDGLAVLHA